MGNSSSRKIAAAVRQKRIGAKAASMRRQEEADPRFVADVMLGRLAKWLRIAGFDVLYSNKFTDDELMAISNLQHRVLLSRDTRLLIRKPVTEFIFLESENIQKQIRQVFETMHISALDSLLTRCLSCNETLVETPRETVRERVPVFVYETQTHFKSCPKCGKIFWAGTHRAAVIQTLQKLCRE
ncbi:MAG: Mut7-C RNAse domain-containing protein [Acidobacteria bacterium]|nr:Mut7-C RNAse domain-containing protein [Acidobacteriota bacterium]